MKFKLWFENNFERPYVQQLFPWMTEEDPVDPKKMGRYKSQDSYIKSQTKGAKNTENAAKEVIASPVGLWEEQLTDLWNNAIVIDHPRKTVRIALANFKTVHHNDRETYRLLAFYQDEDRDLTKQEIMNGDHRQIGGIGYSGGYLTHAWIAPIERGDKVLNLWKRLRNFARMYLGVIGLAPDDKLSSKSFRASQAKYDYDRYLKLKNQ